MLSLPLSYSRNLPAILQPSTPEQLRDALRSAQASKRTIELFGSNSKRLMAGPIEPADLQISTVKMRQILQYEPRDLTISVEAGIPFTELNAELARNGQMIPLDGPYSDEATAGGVVAANISGARRRLYGTARDLVIGMKFATLDGKLVQSGGMVVKNVAGLDMAKLLIGSFGTLAAIASINFKLTPRPAAARTVLFAFEDVRRAMEARDTAIRGVLNPVAVELLNPVLSAQLGFKSFTLALMFSGNEALMERALREAASIGPARALTFEEEQRFWSSLQQVTPRFLEKFREGAVARVSTKLSECGAALASVEGPGHAHAATGIVRGWFSRPDAASRWLGAALKKGWKGVIEFSSESAKRNLALWPDLAGDFAIMKEVKRMFDPENLLNRGRLFGYF
jgi:glycolate oxidase FAD binding subunit